MVHFVRHASDERLQNEFDGVVDWALNPTKSKVVIFVTKKSLVLPSVMDGTYGHRIEEVHSAKLLGFTIDDNMNWNTHCRQVLTLLDNVSIACT